MADREKRRAQILAAAAALYAQHGLENVTFGQIAKRARLSRPLVYFYFPEQKALFLEVVQSSIEKLRQRFEAAYASGRNGLEQIEKIGRAYAAFVQEDPVSFKLCTMFDAHPPDIHCPCPSGAAVRETKLKSNNLCVQAIENGIKDGSIRADIGSPGVVALALWGAVDGIVHLAATEKTALSENGVEDPSVVLDTGIGLLGFALRGGK